MSESMVQVPPQIMGLVTNAVQMAEAFDIADDMNAELAGDDLKGLAKLKKQVTDERFKITRPLDAAKAAAMDAYRPVLEKIDAADQIIRGKLNAYLLEQRRIQQQREREAQERLDAERREIEERARAAREAGDQNAIQAAEDDAMLAELSAPIAPRPNKIAGISQASTWVVDSIDVLALVKAASENPDLLVYLKADTVEINKVVKALKSRHNIPGVSAKEDTGLRVRS